MSLERSDQSATWGGNQVTVLLIDDDQEYLEVLAERLTIRGMTVTTAASGAAALDLLAQGHFDVTVLDLQMPELDGLGVLERLAAAGTTPQVIVLTGHATVARGVRAMQLGAADVLEKPVDIRRLTETISKVAADGHTRRAQARTETMAALSGGGGLAALFRRFLGGGKNG